MTIGGQGKDLSTFVVHYSPLVDRREYLRRKLPSSFPVSWITEKSTRNEIITWSTFDSNEGVLGVPVKRIAEDLGVNSRSLIKPRVIARFEGLIFRVISTLFRSKESMLIGAMPKLSQMPSQILELTKMHIVCMRKAIMNETEWNLILEDDSILCEEFENRVQEISKQRFSYAAWINLNSGAGLHRTKFDKRVNKLGIFEVKPPSTRCSTAYMVNRKYLEAAICMFDKFGVPNFLPIDFMMQIMNRAIHARSYWSEPSVVIQGSESGAYPSSLNKIRTK